MKPAKPEQPPWEFTEHCLLRYRERTGCRKHDDTIKGRLIAFLAGRTYLGNEHWYAMGWVFIIKRFRVVTVMRPKEPTLQHRIYELAQSK